MKKELGVIYFAGGCFWGMEKLMKSIPGVVSAVSGYANGREDILPTYELVCTGRTGYRETVRVEFDPEKVSLDRLLFAFFAVIDPTVENRQGHDIGSQYQTGIYYADEASGETVRRIAAVEKERHRKFAVEIGPLERFYEAEDYHQKYLDRHPDGYCHIPRTSIRKLAEGPVDPGLYRRPDEEELRGRLTPEQFRVTREAGTERPFFNEFWRSGERGIYVDIVTGEPLFSSRDKYDSSCGWPSFSAGLDDAALVELPDDSHFMHRTEVRSRAGNSHLGHVFQGDGESPNGVRYCINSAALRFIPYERMEQEGYGYLMGSV